MFANISPEVLARAREVKLLILDVDGVLTSGQLFMASDGDIIKAFNTLDGHGVKMLQESGVQTAIITARNDNAVHYRAEQLGITHYLHGQHDKKKAYFELLQQADVAQNQCAMVGDDVIDLPILSRCGFPVAVANAHEFVQQHAVWVTQKNGGFGAVREVTDLIMHAQGTLQAALERYLV